MFNFGGGMLTGAEIERQIKKGNISITPYDPSCINPNSINLHLHPQLKIYARGTCIRGNVSKSFLGVDLDKDNKTPKFNLNSIPEGTLEQLGWSSEFDSIPTVRKEDVQYPVVNKLDSLYDLPVIDSNLLEPLDMKKQNDTLEFTIPEEGFLLKPGVLYIGRTVERTWTDKFIPMINGRSSGGRLGLSIHICAGFGDVGFDGTWTLEITCVEPLIIYPNAEIAQVCYFKPKGKIKKEYLYHGRYNKQEDATASRFHLGKLER